MTGYDTTVAETVEGATHADFIQVGLTYRQLDSWVSRGLLRPYGASNPGVGHGRRFPWSEVRVAKVMVRLRDAGLEPEAAHKVARGMGGGPVELAPGVFVEVAA